VALGRLLLEYKAPREAGTWYAHLVTLSNELANCKADGPRPSVALVVLENDGQPRERTPDAKTGALTLHQGHSSAAGGAVGDKDVVEKGLTTVQMHHVKVKDSGRELWALAVYVPKTADAIAGGTTA
jgi:hypothetical protein